jgi:hypothetical protein
MFTWSTREEVSEGSCTTERVGRVQDSPDRISIIESPFRHGQRGGSFAQERDARILAFLDTHPATIAQLLRQGFFPSAETARRRLSKLVKKHKVKPVGFAVLKSGRPQAVYCRYPVKNVEHEVYLTDFLLLYPQAHIIRGCETDKKIRPDAEMRIGDTAYYVELDNGTIGYREIVSERYAKYKDFQGLCLWVATNDIRANGLRDRALPVRHSALFTTLDSVKQQPHGGVWVDYDGKIAALPE